MKTNQEPCKTETPFKNDGNQPRSKKKHETPLNPYGNRPKKMRNYKATLKTMETNHKP